MALSFHLKLVVGLLTIYVFLKIPHNLVLNKFEKYLVNNRVVYNVYLYPFYISVSNYGMLKKYYIHLD